MKWLVWNRLLQLCALFVLVNGCDRWTSYQSTQVPGQLRLGQVVGLSSWSMESALFPQLLEKRGVQVEVIKYANYNELFMALRRGEIDVAAARTTPNLNQQELTLSSVGYDDQFLSLVCNPNQKSKIGKAFYVNKKAVSRNWLQKLGSHYPELQNMSHSDLSAAKQLKFLNRMQGSCALMDSKALNSILPLFPKLEKVKTFAAIENLSLAIRPDSPGLVEFLNDLITHSLRSGQLDSVRFLTSQRPQEFNQFDDQKLVYSVAKVLPSYERDFKRSASFYELPWQLVAAVGYQESHWNPDAKSFSGVRGLMQLTEDTADLMNVEDRLDPRQSIWGGARYLAYLLRQQDEKVVERERIAAALAAYNIGPANLVEAKSICSDRNLNPNIWKNLKRCLLKVPDARGGETVQFVERSMFFWSVLRNKS